MRILRLISGRKLNDPCNAGKNDSRCTSADPWSSETFKNSYTNINDQITKYEKNKIVQEIPAYPAALHHRVLQSGRIEKTEHCNVLH